MAETVARFSRNGSRCVSNLEKVATRSRVNRIGAKFLRYFYRVPVFSRLCANKFEDRNKDRCRGSVSSSFEKFIYKKEELRYVVHRFQKDEEDVFLASKVIKS